MAGKPGKNKVNLTGFNQLIKGIFIRQLTIIGNHKI
jgi:hypothetical protein